MKKEEVERRKESAAPPAEKAPAVTTGNGSEMESMQKVRTYVRRTHGLRRKSSVVNQRCWGSIEFRDASEGKQVGGLVGNLRSTDGGTSPR